MSRLLYRLLPTTSHPYKSDFMLKEDANQKAAAIVALKMLCHPNVSHKISVTSELIY
jgi:hypothetical protein